MKKILILILAFAPLPCFADSVTPHPVIEKHVEQFHLPADVGSLPSERLIALKNEFLGHLRHYERLVQKTTKNDAVLLDALRQYDRQRAKIVQIIPQLIDDYRTGGQCARKMREYAAGFAKIHNEYHDKLTTPEAYKAYDFRLGIAYFAFWNGLEQCPDFHRQLKRDMDDEKTTMGAYEKELERSRRKVEEVNAGIKEVHIIRQIRTALERIDQELISRHSTPS